MKASKSILKNIRINSCACVGIKNICFEGSRIVIKQREKERIMASDRLYAHINYSRNYLELGKVFNWTRDVSAKEE